MNAIELPRVLVVDDSEKNRRLLVDLLTAKGHRVTAATSGEEALASVEAAPPDLVLLDVMMPGLSGYEVCEQLRADPRHAFLPIVLVTALDPAKERLRGLEAGADDFLAKPINSSELLARVRSLLRVKAMHDELVRLRNKTLLDCLPRGGADAAAERAAAQPGLAQREFVVVHIEVRGAHTPKQRSEVEELAAALHDLRALAEDGGGRIERLHGDEVVMLFDAAMPDALLRAARCVIQALRVTRERFQPQGDGAAAMAAGVAQGSAWVGASPSASNAWEFVAGPSLAAAAALGRYAVAGEILFDAACGAAMVDQIPLAPAQVLIPGAGSVRAWRLRADNAGTAP
jgi:adenylate cyclase